MGNICQQNVCTDEGEVGRTDMGVDPVQKACIEGFKAAGIRLADVRIKVLTDNPEMAKVLFAKDLGLNFEVCLKLYDKNNFTALQTCQREINFANLMLTRPKNWHLLEFLENRFYPVTLKLPREPVPFEVVLTKSKLYTTSLTSNDCVAPEKTPDPLHLLFDQITYALEELWLLELLHLDIKPDNIFVDQPSEQSPACFVLGDLGSSKPLSTEYIGITGGTPLYTAPERSWSPDQEVSSNNDPQGQNELRGQNETPVNNGDQTPPQPKQSKLSSKTCMDVFSFGKTLTVIANQWQKTKAPQKQMEVSQLAKNLFHSMSVDPPEYSALKHTGRLPADRLRLNGFGVTATVLGLAIKNTDPNRQDDKDILFIRKVTPVKEYIKILRVLDESGNLAKLPPTSSEKTVFLWNALLFAASLHVLWILEYKDQIQLLQQSLPEDDSPYFTKQAGLAFECAQSNWGEKGKQFEKLLLCKDVQIDTGMKILFDLLNHLTPTLETEVGHSEYKTYHFPKLGHMQLEQILGSVGLYLQLDCFAELSEPQRKVLILYAPSNPCNELRPLNWDGV